MDKKKLFIGRPNFIFFTDAAVVAVAAAIRPRVQDY